jgi:hypothetical protein
MNNTIASAAIALKKHPGTVLRKCQELFKKRTLGIGMEKGEYVIRKDGMRALKQAIKPIGRPKQKAVK